MNQNKTDRPFLTKAGYKEYKSGENVRLFTKPFVMYKGQRFIEVREHDYDETGPKYELSSSFELPDGHSARITFYTFRSEKELTENLSTYEDKAREVFLALNGVGQT